MISTYLKYEIFNDESQQSISVILYDDDDIDNVYASIEVPTMELVMNKEQLEKLGVACQKLSTMMK